MRTAQQSMKTRYKSKIFEQVESTLSHKEKGC